MKLIVAVVDDKDTDKVMKALTDEHIGVTCVSSTGNFFIPGSSTLLIGVDDEQVSPIMRGIADMAGPRLTHVPLMHAGDISFASHVEVPVGGFMSFVLDVDQFEQV